MNRPGWVLDMSLLQKKLDTVALALAHKIEREWPKRLEHLRFAQGFFSLTVRLSRITYRTVCYLCADPRLNELEWRWYYTLSVASMNRTILDAIFNVVFMLEDLEKRSDWYHKSGWKETHREYLRYLETYGNDPDPQWANWLANFQMFVQEGVKHFHITQDDIKEKNWWPNPGKMIDYGVDRNARPLTRQFLAYLNDWFYRETSAQNHQSSFGFLRIGGLLLADDPSLTDEQRARVESEFYPHYRAVQVSRSVIMLLALVSEIDHYFEFDLAPRVIELWTIVIRVPEGKEIYDKRYAAWWPLVNSAG
jgi:hypothetical protein